VSRHRRKPGRNFLSLATRPPHEHPTEPQRTLSPSEENAQLRAENEHLRTELAREVSEKRELQTQIEFLNGVPRRRLRRPPTSPSWVPTGSKQYSTESKAVLFN
jgi:hypothetical protein